MSISLKQFEDNRINRICRHPRGLDGQCVCLIRNYFDDVLELPQFPTVAAAKNLWGVIDQEEFQRIPNTLFAIPKAGDIFVMDAFRGNTYGHTGIVLDGAYLFRFLSFDSNWSVRKVARVESHGYLNPRIFGWFRMRGPNRLLHRINQALREAGDTPGRSVGTLTLSKWWQNRIMKNSKKFSDDENGYQALLGAIRWHQAKHRYPHDNT